MFKPHIKFDYIGIRKTSYELLTSSIFKKWFFIGQADKDSLSYPNHGSLTEGEGSVWLTSLY